MRNLVDITLMKIDFRFLRQENGQQQIVFQNVIFMDNMIPLMKLSYSFVLPLWMIKRKSWIQHFISFMEYF